MFCCSYVWLKFFDQFRSVLIMVLLAVAAISEGWLAVVTKGGLMANELALRSPRIAERWKP
jgi:hypothetical protein